jgi:hypothetical protein
VTQAAVQYILPSALIGRPDIARILRELEALDNELEAQRARNHTHDKKASYQLPNMSRALSDFLTTNKIDIASDHVRMDTRSQLRRLKDHAPVIHMVFASEADPESMQQIVAWIRDNLHPQALITVGVQPSLIGGVYIRTPNHIHDFSLRSHMKDSRNLIVESLDKLIRSPQA